MNQTHAKRIVVGLLLGGCLLACGCRRDEDVRVYDAPKDEPARAVGPAAIGQLPEGHPPIDGSPAGATDGGAAPIEWQLPPDWQVDPNDRPMRYATLLAGEGEARIEISVVPLAGDAGGELANVNRWRAQLGLAPIVEGQLEQAVARVPVGGGMAMVIELVGPAADAGGSQRMLAAAIPHDGRTWFIKAVGPDVPVAAQKDAFNRFVSSIRFTAAAGR